MSFSSACFSLLFCTLSGAVGSFVVLLLCGLSLVVSVMVGGGGCFSRCSTMLSSGSVFVCLLSWLHRKCSAYIGVGLMCHPLHVIIFLFWWCVFYMICFCGCDYLALYGSMGPQSHIFCWTTTVDLMGRKTNFLEVSFSFISALPIY